MSSNKLLIYTDGSCSGNPGAGGWAASIHDGDIVSELSGGFAKTTNNRMELYSVIAALEAISDRDDAVAVYSDSRYLVDMINNGHAQRWQQNGWMRDRKNIAQNSDLWERLLRLCQERDIEFIWVKGHDGHAHNERMDQLAVEARNHDGLPDDEGFINPTISPNSSLFGQQMELFL